MPPFLLFLVRTAGRLVAPLRFGSNCWVLFFSGSNLSCVFHLPRDVLPWTQQQAAGSPTSGSGFWICGLLCSYTLAWVPGTQDLGGLGDAFPASFGGKKPCLRHCYSSEHRLELFDSSLELCQCASVWVCVPLCLHSCKCVYVCMHILWRKA